MTELRIKSDEILIEGQFPDLEKILTEDRNSISVEKDDEVKNQNLEIEDPNCSSGESEGSNRVNEESEEVKSDDSIHSNEEDSSDLESEEPPKKRKIGGYDPEEEARLEASVFGIIEKNDESKSEQIEQSPAKKKKTKRKEVAAAWVDKDDEECSVDSALQKQNRKLPLGQPEKVYKKLLENKFTNLVGTPKWAVKRDIIDDIKSGKDVSKKESKRLAGGLIDLKVMNPINKQTHLEGPYINSVQFHKTSSVALVAGSAGILSLFEINGIENSTLATQKFEKFPIHTARFLGEGREILIGSMSYDYCYSYNMMMGTTRRIPLPHGVKNLKNFEVSPDGRIIASCGRLGEIHLISSKSKELIGTMKMNKKCASLAFTPDSSKIISTGESNELYIWDVSSRKCLNRAVDDGCLSGSSVTVSPNGQYIATGSKQGAVNIYEAKSVFSETYPLPLKTILNLTTSITKLRFNPTTEILAMASDCKHNAFRMIHLPSFKVFSNFPTFGTKMYMPLDVDFSPESGFMSVTNNRGYAYLYRLKKYGNY